MSVARTPAFRFAAIYTYRDLAMRVCLEQHVVASPLSRCSDPQRVIVVHSVLGLVLRDSLTSMAANAFSVSSQALSRSACTASALFRGAFAAADEDTAVPGSASSLRLRFVSACALTASSWQPLSSAAAASLLSQLPAC